jgi:hypothetical protein
MLFVLVLEKEEKIKDLLQVNGLVEVNYWVSFLGWNFFILSVSTGVFMWVGWKYVGISFFQKGSMLIMFWFLSAWNFSQIGFSLFVSSFIKKSTTGTLVGYSLSVFLILFLTMNSQFLFPNPSYLPWFFYLIPQSPFVRYFYLSISRCIERNCVSSLGDIFEGEMFWVFLMIHVTGLTYFFGGLMLNEPKWKQYIFQMLKSIPIFGARKSMAKNGKLKLMDTENDSMISVSGLEM